MKLASRHAGMIGMELIGERSGGIYKVDGAKL